MGLQPLEKNNDLVRYIQKECKIELFSIQRVIPLRDDETNLELQVTLVDTKLIACIFHSVLIQHAYLCVDRATLERPAYLCVDRSDITTAGVCSCWRGIGESMNNANICSCRWTASGVLVRDYVIWFWKSPFYVC